MHRSRERHRHTARGLLDSWGASPECRPAPELDEFADSSNLLSASRPHDVQAATVGADDNAPWTDLQRLLKRIGGWVNESLSLDNGLTLAMFRERVGRWVRGRFEQDASSGPNGARDTLVVTSAGVIAAVLCEVMDLPDSHFMRGW